MSNIKNMSHVKRIAFVAQDNKKTDLIEWSYFNKDVLMQHQITAAGTTGDILEGTLNIPVSKLSGGPMGGYQQLNTLIAEGKIDILIFFWNAMESPFEKSDIKVLLNTALTANILISHNIPTADFILNSVLMDKEYPRTIAELPAQAVENEIKN